MRTLYFRPAVSSSSSFLFIAYSQLSQVGYFHTWCGLSANLGCRSEMCCTRLNQWIKYRTQKSSKVRHLRTIAQICRIISLQLRNLSTIWKKVLNSNISPKCPNNDVNIGSLGAEIGSGVWGTPANFNGFRVLASLLQRCRSTEGNQTLHDVWPSPGLVHYIYIFGGSCHVREFRKVQYSVSCVLRYWQCYCMALEQWASAKLCGVEQRARTIFDRAAITFDIVPHSTNVCHCQFRHGLLLWITVYNELPCRYKITFAQLRFLCDMHWC